jgi:23S rRNA (pseudouridine1915-N3)-methyltransferase
MKITLLCVGKLRSAPLKEVCADYLSRLQRYGAAEIEEVKAADSGSAEASVAQESTRLLAALKPNDAVFILDERGAQMTSPELAELLNKQELRSVKRCVCVLGGAYGLSSEVRAKGKMIALSKLTLPHELCRALVLEQLYRARTIQRGEPYHHGG